MRLKRTAHAAVTAGLCTAMMFNSTPLAAIAEEVVDSGAPALEQAATDAALGSEDGTTSGDVVLNETDQTDVAPSDETPSDAAPADEASSDAVPDEAVPANAGSKAGTAGNGVAFDACCFSSYTNTKVTVAPDAGSIEGGIELSNYNGKPVNLEIKGGDLSKAKILVGQGAEKVSVTRDPSVTLAAPEGYQWLNNQLVTPSENNVAAVDSNGKVTQYESVGAAIDAANGQAVTLLADVSEDVVVKDGVAAVIDLAGHKLTNYSGHTITNEGTLTVRDSAGGGVVDNITNAHAAVFNEVGATATLEAGTFSRSAEESKDENSSGGNSYYTLLNHGTMTIKGGVTVCQGANNTGQFSSLVENGWQNGAQNTTKVKSVMVIEGGRFVGGLNTIKNDDYGELTIKGGSFENVKQAAVLNWNVATISGGTFDSQNVAILNGKLDDAVDRGELVITGGEFKAPTIVGKMGGANTSGSIEISGGTFKGAFPAPEKIDGSLRILGGTFSDPSAEEFVVLGSGLEVDGNGQLGVAQVKLVFADSVKDGVFSYDVKGGKAPAIDLLSLVYLNVTNQSGNYSVVLPDSAANEALHKAVAKADTSKVHEIKVQALDGTEVVDEQVLKVQLTDSAAPAPAAKVTVTFESGAGDSFTRVVEVGSKLERPADPKLEGWEFKGWFKVKNADGTLSEEWNFDEDVVSEDMTLYGGWVKKGASAGEKPAKPGSSLPTTGDASTIGVAATGAAGVLAIAGGYLASKRRKQ